ncbi:MAG: hypothetical protein IKX68_00630 [Clostridiales bacterium]|nr:hypothetical protein [Clostridiales bacterium]
MLMNGNGKNQENKKINAIVLLIASVLSAGILLSGCGGFNDPKDKTTTSKETTEIDTTEEYPIDIVDDVDDTEATDDTSDDPDVGGHVPVTKVDQITDKMFQTLRGEAEDYFQDDVVDKLPDGVTVKDLNYFFMVIFKDSSAAEDDDCPYNYSLFYQVVVTDETGDAPTEECFFWHCGFPGLYQDGSIDKTSMIDLGRRVCFDNWSVSGFESTESVEGFVKMWSEDPYVDSSYRAEPLLPVNGQAYEPVLPCGGINSLSELTKGELRFMDEYSRQVFEESYIPEGAALKELELLGQFKSYDAGDYYHFNLVVMVYKAHLTFEEDGETKESVHYWYQGFWNPYCCGEIHLDKPVTPGPDTIKPCGLEVRGCRSMQELFTEFREDYNAKEIEDSNIPEDA